MPLPYVGIAVVIVGLLWIAVVAAEGDSRLHCSAFVLATMGILTIACSSTPQAVSPPSAEQVTTVNVTENEWMISPSTTSVKAGDVRFVAKNTGSLTHELIVVKTDAAASQLPVYAANDKVADGHVVGDVNEDQVTSSGELDDIAASQAKDATFKLSAGKYLLLCNQPGHYKSGMVASFTVQ